MSQRSEPKNSLAVARCARHLPRGRRSGSGTGGAPQGTAGVRDAGGVAGTAAGGIASGGLCAALFARRRARPVALGPHVPWHVVRYFVEIGEQCILRLPRELVVRLRVSQLLPVLLQVPFMLALGILEEIDVRPTAEVASAPIGFWPLPLALALQGRIEVPLGLFEVRERDSIRPLVLIGACPARLLAAIPSGGSSGQARGVTSARGRRLLGLVEVAPRAPSQFVELGAESSFLLSALFRALLLGVLLHIPLDAQHIVHPPDVPRLLVQDIDPAMPAHASGPRRRPRAQGNLRQSPVATRGGAPKAGAKST
mmetsp:Transcript_74478/g.206868  ORF Transcript_74478/g.206868 Transcript_74478/m.206868 type:complete len:311 (+) Transcript_74478:399-1331(+)